MLSVLNNRTYRHLFTAQVIALVSTGLMTVALSPLRPAGWPARMPGAVLSGRRPGHQDGVPGIFPSKTTKCSGGHAVRASEGNTLALHSQSQ